MKLNHIGQVFLATSAYTKRTFKNDKVFLVPRHQKFTRDVIQSFQMILGHDNFDIFKDGPDETHVYIRHEQASNFQEFLEEADIPGQVIVEDLQSLIDEEMNSYQSKYFSDGSFNYQTYHNFEEIDAWIDDFADQYSDYVTVEDVGLSYENRPIRALKISDPNTISNKSSFYFSGQHAREWLSPATTMLVFETFMQNFLNGDENTDEVQLLSGQYSMDFYYVPIMNPDGYSYTWTNNRLWRKNRRQPEPDSGCVGIDLNRNWATKKWGDESGSDPYPCSNVYSGPSALSEPENQAIANYVKNIQKTSAPIVVSQDVHTFSQLWMFPYGEDCTEDAPNFGNLTLVGDAAVEAIKSVNNVEYFVSGSICNTIYPSAGCNVDYFYQDDDIAIPCSTTVELRDTGDYGFIIPDRYIDISAREMYAGYMSMWKMAAFEGLCNDRGY